MVFFNYATMQMAAKIVYYGPGLCGKTTNLHHIYAKTSPQSRGEMVSLETETDRTLFFDLLPIDVGVIGGFKTRLQLYTIPGQVFYNTTRKLVLKGVDGIVFVADSQKPMLEANIESFRNLRDNLAEIGLNLDDLPLVVQLNKRDLPNILDKETILRALDPQGQYEACEASAVSGMGVFETLKTISKLTLRTLRRRMTGDDSKPASPAPPRRLPTEPSLRVREDTVPSFQPPRPAPIAPPAPTPFLSTPPPPAPAAPVTAFASSGTQSATAVEVAPPQIETQPEAFVAPPAAIEETAFGGAAETDDSVGMPLPRQTMAIDLDAPMTTQYIPPAARVEPEPKTAPPVPETLAEPQPAEQTASAPTEPVAPEAFEAPEIPEPEVVFSQTVTKPEAPQVKHVKVRSSIDVMAELEALRKRATTSQPPRPKKDSPAAPVVMPEIPLPKRDVYRNLAIHANPGVLAKTKNVRVTVSFEDERQGVIQQQEQVLELGDASDVQALLLNLKIDNA
jgi:signal recognition particle receptor subunit beta